jgi:hypothetical protein
MYCPKCKTEVSDSSKLCGSCGVALESGSHPSNNSSGGATDNDPPSDSIIKELLADNDIGSLVNWFLWISIFDIGLMYIYSHYKIIPSLYKDASTPIEEAAFMMLILGGFYLAFRFWGIAKASTIPFYIFLVFVTLIVYTAFFAADATIFREFGLYIRSPHDDMWVEFSIYEHFIAGIGLQTLIVLRILFLLNKQSEQK